MNLISSSTPTKQLYMNILTPAKNTYQYTNTCKTITHHNILTPEDNNISQNITLVCK